MIDRIKETLSSANLDFVGKFRIAAIASTVLVLLSWASFFVLTPNWGIDFSGGTEIKLGFVEDVDIGEVRGALRTLGLDEDAVQEVRGGRLHEFDIRIKDASFGSDELRTQVLDAFRGTFGPEWVVSDRFDAEVGARLSVIYAGEPVMVDRVAESLANLEGIVVELGRQENEVVVKMPGLSQQIEKTIRGAMGDREFQVLSVDAVGPKVGGDLRQQGFVAILATLLLVLVYIGFRFDIAFAPGAILALIHDVSITLGVFVLLHRELNINMIGALLTIVGYSLNDTIIVYDRIRENMEKFSRNDLGETINRSVNETLARTIGTSLTTVMAITPLLFLGGPVIQNFALAMTIGVFVGTYSSVYIASPFIIAMQRVKPMLGRFVVGGGAEEPDAEAVAAEEAGLTESEKRRRERAALLKEGDAR
jgi:preprotein translocase subunit SecF